MTDWTALESPLKPVLDEDWRALESLLDERPIFPVQAPDGKRHWAEADRQATFRGQIRMRAPRLMGWANANAGKRAVSQAQKEGVTGGVFDYTVTDGPEFIAFPEFKGYDKRGRAGKLSQKQIDWGNRMHRAGHHVACWFCPYAAVEWIRSLRPQAFIDGAPVPKEK